MRIRMSVMLAIFGVCVFIPLVIQLYNLQIVQHEELERRAIAQQTRGTVVEADRGVIYDRNGKVLAASASVETIYLAPVYIESDEEARFIAQGLSEILELDYDEVYEKTTDRSSYYQRVQRKVEKDVADEVREFKSENGLTAIQIEPDTKRYYPLGSTASQLIGFVNVDGEGLEGVEYSYDEELTGVAGKIVTAKNAAGTSMSYKFEKYYDEQDGYSLVLTIDATMQQIVEKHLEQAVIDCDLENRASAIVMNPKTGEILVDATTGGVDLNNPRELSEEQEASLAGLSEEEATAKRTEYWYANWRNKTISDTYDPGSIFKLITCSMALEEGTVTLDSTFSCTGSAMVRGWSKPINCWKRAGHGTQTLTRAVQNSCNPAFIQIGLSVGQEKFYSYLQAFGFGQYTNIALSGEATGLLHDYQNFISQEVSLAVAAFGQTFTATPIQVATAISAVVNGGYLMEPHIVKEIQDSDGNVVETIEPTAVRQVISEETSATMRYLAEQVVADGSGRNAQVAGYRIGGKTATSEKTGELDNEGKYVASFIAIAPADDPEIVLLVQLDTPGESIPQSQRSGGYLAAPLAGRILAELLPYLGYEPEYSGDEMFGKQVTVPDVIGDGVETAKERLTTTGFANVRVVGDGETVLGQLPASGASITAGQTVIIYTETETPSDLVTVPKVVGLSPQNANTALTNAGLFIKPAGALSSQTSTIQAATQSVAAGEQVPRGTIIEVSFLDTNVSDFAGVYG